jgi:hypothetical protein
VDNEVIAGSRARAVLTTIGCLLFVAIGGWLVGFGPRGFIVGLVCIGVFGLFGVLGVAAVIRPNRLTLSPAGFLLERVFRRPRFIAWTDLDSVFVWTYRGTRLVAYRFRPGRSPADAITRFNQSLGIDGGLPGGWRLGTDALLARLHSWQERFSSPEANAAAHPAGPSQAGRRR